MNEKACCVTGHRNIPADKAAYVKAKLKEEVEAAIADGYTTFISGMDDGVDLIFAELVLEQKERYPNLFLEAAIPYRNRINEKTSLFRKCLAACNVVRVQQEIYGKDGIMNRNRYMVSLSSQVVAVHDGREKGGTVFTMRYAHMLEREIREIRI